MTGSKGARPKMVVYTHSLLEPSMTFVLSHAEALRRYDAVYAGAHRVSGLALPAERSFTANRGGAVGRANEFLFRRFGMVGGLARQLARFRPSLVHAHFGLSGPAGLILARALDVPLVVTYHGQDATISDEDMHRSWRGREYLRGRAAVMREAGAIIAVSDFIRGRLLEKGYPPEKVTTHYNGIDVKFFQAARIEREAVIVFVGRFVEKKGCESLLRAAGLLQQRGAPIRLIVIGDGPLGPELRRLSSELGLDATFTGFLPSAEVRRHMGLASAVAVPSVTASNGDSEGLPTVILEAQALATPVIATRHAGNAEGVLEGRSALLVGERDVPALAEAMHHLISNPAAVQSFGDAGRRHVQDRFDLDRQVEGLERIYDRARHQYKGRS